MKTMMMMALLMVSGAAQAAPIDLSQSVEMRLGDVLDIYARMASTNINASLDNDTSASAKLDSIDIVLADADGKTHVNLVFTPTGMVKLQAAAPAQQMRDLEGLRAVLAGRILGTIGPKNEPAFGHVKRPPSDMRSAARAFFESRKVEDFVLNVAFRQDGVTHLYSITTPAGTTFNAKAPAARLR